MEPRDMLLSKEWDGRGYYERCGEEAGIAEFASIFRMLSQDELRHAEALRALQSGAAVELGASGTLDGARKMLRRLWVQNPPAARFCGNPGSYRLAMQFEASSARACGRLADEAVSGWERELFLRMAAEDEIHFTLLEEMHELLQEPGAGDGE